MNQRKTDIANTRTFVLSVCALIGIGGVLSITNADTYPLLKISAVAFGLAILIAIVHIGILWWEDLYNPNASDDNVTWKSIRVRGQFSLLLFIALIALGLIPVIYHAATV